MNKPRSMAPKHPHIPAGLKPPPKRAVKPHPGNRGIVLPAVVGNPRIDAIRDMIRRGERVPDNLRGRGTPMQMKKAPRYDDNSVMGKVHRKMAKRNAKNPPMARLYGRGAPNSWATAVGLARRDLGITGFKPIKKGTALYNRAKQIHARM